MVERRAFLTGAGAASIALVAGVAPAAPDFDPAIIFRELDAAGLHVSWVRPVGRDAKLPFYFISPRRGGFTTAHLDLMAKWADALDQCQDKAERLGAFLAEFERSESTPG